MVGFAPAVVAETPVTAARAWSIVATFFVSIVAAFVSARALSSAGRVMVRTMTVLLLASVVCGAQARGFGFGLGAIPAADLPVEGRQVLASIEAGGPFAFRRDGILFGNREGALPPRPRGYYAEYTVPTPGERTRGARRIIAGRGRTGDFRTSNEYYYTADHYQSFRRILQ